MRFGSSTTPSGTMPEDGVWPILEEFYQRGVTMVAVRGCTKGSFLPPPFLTFMKSHSRLQASLCCERRGFLYFSHRSCRVRKPLGGDALRAGEVRTLENPLRTPSETFTLMLKGLPVQLMSSATTFDCVGAALAGDRLVVDELHERRCAMREKTIVCPSASVARKSFSRTNPPPRSLLAAGSKSAISGASPLATAMLSYPTTLTTEGPVPATQKATTVRRHR